MSKYRFSICSYHAIKEADILIDGITVLAGPNGCGKSTISRWLYYMIDIATDFDSYLVKGYKTEINSLLQNISRAIREMWGLNRGVNNGLNILQSIDDLKLDDNFSLDSIGEYSGKLHLFIGEFASQLDKFLNAENVQEQRKDRVLNFLNQNLDGEEKARNAQAFAELISLQVDKMQQEVLYKSEERSLTDVWSFLHTYLYEDEKVPFEISLQEEGVNIISDGRIGSLFNLDKAIYIDTPMAFGLDDFLKNVFWQRLRKLMLEENGCHDKQNIRLLYRISEILNGEINVSDSLLGNKEMYYERKDGKLLLPLDKIATGMKSFAYLFQLIKNGYLDDKTVLMIDEPEVHLHPQWVVVFARLLILIRKSLGVKIVLASHNPDFVAAIKAIAKKEEILAETNFYLAQSVDDDGFQYAFKSLGSDIEPIFNSFNIALERIQQYGDTDL
jgi:predicted ATP-dependent endonuclease of OLD family